MLKRFAPPIVCEIEDISILWKIIEGELEKLQNNINRLPCAAIAPLADEFAIIRLEKLYELSSLGLPLFDRKALSVMAQAIEKPFAMDALENALEALVGGREAFSVEFNKEYQWLKVGLNASDAFIRQVFCLIRDMIPANLTLTVEKYEPNFADLSWKLIDEEGTTLTDEEGMILVDKELE